jgi:hypothetical protein
VPLVPSWPGVNQIQAQELHLRVKLKVGRPVEMVQLAGSRLQQY